MRIMDVHQEPSGDTWEGDLKMSTTTEETKRFTEYMQNHHGIIMPYTLTADEICGGNISRIIEVSIMIAGVRRVMFTPWKV
jgi:hypothetical protein